MKKVINPERSTWQSLCQRPSIETDFLESSVKNILNRVRTSGDDALLEFALQFDKARITSVRVSDEEIKNATDQISPKLAEAIRIAGANISKFHAAQLRNEEKIITSEGVYCWRKAVPIERVGIYIPGGTAPLFSTVLMLALPARIAGCKEIILCTPPGKDGKVAPEILFTASFAGVTKIFKAGGAQAIGAMAYCTESIPGVQKIFGPGNQYVTKAKQMVNQQGIAIDLPAGPSEVMVIADKHANPAFVAADLLSQAEHGTDSQVMLVTTDDELTENVEAEIRLQLALLPRKEIAQGALQNSVVVQFSDYQDIIDFTNTYAPEHLIINTTDAESLATHVVNAGSVFLGAWSPESAGDYASGTNHTLPTGGHAKAYSGVSVESFQKMITFQQLTESGLRTIGPAVMQMAEAEGLNGHKNSIAIRLANT